LQQGRKASILILYNVKLVTLTGGTGYDPPFTSMPGKRPSRASFTCTKAPLQQQKLQMYVTAMDRMEPVRTGELLNPYL